MIPYELLLRGNSALLMQVFDAQNWMSWLTKGLNLKLGWQSNMSLWAIRHLKSWNATGCSRWSREVYRHGFMPTIQEKYLPRFSRDDKIPLSLCIVSFQRSKLVVSVSETGCLSCMRAIGCGMYGTSMSVSRCHDHHALKNWHGVARIVQIQGNKYDLGSRVLVFRVAS